MPGFWDRRIVPFLIEKACRSANIREERERIVPQAFGHVLEVGVGTGLNLGFYSAAQVLDLIAVDPSAAILEKARERVTSCSVPVVLQEASAESLAFDAGRFDSVVMTYSLCSMGNPVSAMREVRRVLKPTGKLFFIEHGLARTRRTRFLQHTITPAWKRLSGNCHLDRNIPEILGQAGFQCSNLVENDSDFPSWARYTYEGVAVAGA